MENGEPVPGLRRHGPSCVLGEWRWRADRRAKAHIRLSAVVVRFSRSMRFERQEILVEELALECAEQECFADDEMPVSVAERDALQPTGKDRELVARIAVEIRRPLPGCSPGRAQEVAGHAAVRGSGRVGRTAAGRGERLWTVATIARSRAAKPAAGERRAPIGDLSWPCERAGLAYDARVDFAHFPPVDERGAERLRAATVAWAPLLGELHAVGMRPYLELEHGSHDDELRLYCEVDPDLLLEASICDEGLPDTPPAALEEDWTAFVQSPHGAERYLADVIIEPPLTFALLAIKLRELIDAVNAGERPLRTTW